MTILKFRSDPRFAACASAFLVTGKTNDPQTDSLNRRLLQQSKTGYWVIAEGRIRPGDAAFLVLPNQSRRDGYPRKLYAGVVSKILPYHPDRTVLVVNKFFQLDDVPSRVRDFLEGKTPPQGNTALQVWSPVFRHAESTQFDARVQRSFGGNQAARLSRLQTARKLPKRVETVTVSFVRNPDVVAEVLYQAQGKCADCTNLGPFLSPVTGLPFLEVHHLFRLADGGEDTIENAVALCPNCHRKRHYS